MPKVEAGEHTGRRRGRPPKKRAAGGRSTDTPLMRQYLELKAQHPDAILFFRLGDFYEMFLDDAVVAARALELTLTSRDKNAEDPIPMCGVPHHAVKGYIRRMLDQGFKVAICEQVEDPKLARGIVRRAVTQVVTPGVVLDTDHLDAARNNYLAAVAVRRGATGAIRSFGLAALDLSTFELRAAQLDGAASLVDELARLAPREVIFPAAAAEALDTVRKISPGAWHAGDELLFGAAAGDRRLVEEKTDQPLEAWGAIPLAMGAAAAALRYAEQTQPTTGVPRCRLQLHRDGEHLLMDEATLRNLEVFEAIGGGRQGALLGVVDETCTAMGGRLLRRALALPLRDVAAIRRRQDAVEFLVDGGDLRERLRDALRRIYDLERLTSRTVLGVANPRELRRLGDSLRQLPRLAELLTQGAALTIGDGVPELLSPGPDQLEDVAGRIAACLVDDPPISPTAGGLVRVGFDAELDEVIELCEGGKSNIAAIEQRERERTGIGSLKIRYNKVFGYFIEITRANLQHVPDDYQRKQTLANAERFVTEELAEYETKVLTAEQRRHNLEQRIFETLRGQVAEQATRLAAVAERVASLDMLAGFAEVAARHGYCRPVVDESESLEIVAGRHPVVERHLPPGEFVPNDVRIDDEARLLIITGPNMAGKSTAMRQVAQIALLAQVGGFVPCESCRLGVVDRIFTRVGASDNLARGESTFMVEMRETATILAQATPRSLVVLDEIGRGTSTYDGISIAWAVAEQIHDAVRARTMFATHYHELCALADVKQRVRNFTIAIQHWKGKIVFLRRLIEGGSSRSYGIEVAELAGLDASVVKRARRVLGALERGDVVEGVVLRGRNDSSQLGLFDAPAPAATPAAGAEVLQALRQLDPNRLTPIQALNALAELVELAGD